MAKVEVEVNVKNGPELARLLECLIDAGVLVQCSPSSEAFAAAKKRLKGELGDLKWVKKLLSYDANYAKPRDGNDDYNCDIDG